MGNSKKNFSALFLIISILLGTMGGYLLSAFLPAEEIFGLGDTDPEDQPGRLIQTIKINGTDTNVGIDDSDSATIVIPGLEDDITVEFGSRIAINVNYFYTIAMYTGFEGYAKFESAIEIDGEEKIIGTMFGYRATELTDSQYDSGMMHLYYITDPLVNGTYSVRIVFRGIPNPTPTSTESTLTLVGGAFDELPQLTIQEFSGTLLFEMHPVNLNITQNY